MDHYRDLEKEIQNSGSMFKWQPPTIAMFDSPVRKLWQATCSATRLDEQAVSVVKLGPRRSKKCDILLDCIAYAQPVDVISGHPHITKIIRITHRLLGAWEWYPDL